jgi:hypothetical protein
MEPHSASLVLLYLVAYRNILVAHEPLENLILFSRAEKVSPESQKQREEEGLLATSSRANKYPRFAVFSRSVVSVKRSAREKVWSEEMITTALRTKFLGETLMKQPSAWSKDALMKLLSSAVGKLHC